MPFACFAVPFLARRHRRRGPRPRPAFQVPEAREGRPAREGSVGGGVVRDGDVMRLASHGGAGVAQALPCPAVLFTLGL